MVSLSSLLLGIICFFTPSWDNNVFPLSIENNLLSLFLPLYSLVLPSSLLSSLSIYPTPSANFGMSVPRTFIPLLGYSCVIQGVDSGICKEPKDFIKEMPFCGQLVKYSACVPKEYAWFPNHTLAKKDSWARRTYASVLKRRIAIEARILPEDLSKYSYYEHRSIIYTDSIYRMN